MQLASKIKQQRKKLSHLKDMNKESENKLHKHEELNLSVATSGNMVKESCERVKRT